jgi:hypothetical protein
MSHHQATRTKPVATASGLCLHYFRHLFFEISFQEKDVTWDTWFPDIGKNVPLIFRNIARW